MATAKWRKNDVLNSLIACYAVVETQSEKVECEVFNFKMAAYTKLYLKRNLESHSKWRKNDFVTSITLQTVLETQ